MTFEDDRWAYDRIMAEADITECSSFRCSIDGVIHRMVVRHGGASVRPHQRWMTICGVWPEACPPALVDHEPVDCLGCIAAGA